MRRKNSFAFGFLLLVVLFCSASAYAQEEDIQKPKIKAQTTEPTSSIYGHGYVDLGLSVKWATCNVGASSPSDYGNYFAWGEIRTKSSYTKENSVTYGKEMDSIAGNPNYDAATAIWGGTWRLPTMEEIKELETNCTREWKSQGGLNGCKITGPNGNSIFLPAAGYYSGTSLSEVGKKCYYWSARPLGDDSNSGAVYLSYGSGSLGFMDVLMGWSRPDGYTIRPVTE